MSQARLVEDYDLIEVEMDLERLREEVEELRHELASEKAARLEWQRESLRLRYLLDGRARP